MKLFETLFPGVKVQKISVNAGFSCPNRDGTIGTGGCIYCDNSSFTPAYCLNGDSVTRQLEEGKRFFARKYPGMKYLAYFQSFTSTHTSSITLLRDLYRQALESDDVVGMVIGTRPDTFTEEVASLLGEINATHPVIVEIGAETSDDRTLRLINRHHTWKDVADAVGRCHRHSLHCGLHLIAGLPGEDDDAVLRTVAKACALDVDTIKLHQLQIIEGTTLHREWEAGRIDVHPYGLEEYLSLCERIVRLVDGRVEIERFTSQAPPGRVVAPRWGLKNYQFTNLLHNRLRNGSTSDDGTGTVTEN